MSHWAREIAGWVLLSLGLLIFYQSYDFLLRKRIFEAMPMAFAGFVVFRGGIHLLKVAVAAQAAKGLRAAATVAVKRPRPTARPVGPTGNKSVMPGPQNPPRRPDDTPAPASAARNRE